MKADNELIAEFMGFTKDARGFYTGGRFALRFNTSWNELMPVVEKIESLDDTCAIHIDRTCCFLHSSWEWNCKHIQRGDDETKIQMVYRAVVEFIKWHNENKKP